MVKHEVYVATKEDGGVLYVGQGRIGRSSHCDSGTSHVYELNRMHFSGETINVEIVGSGLSKEEAQKKEVELIHSLRPELNTVNNSDFRQDLANKSVQFNIFVKEFMVGIYGGYFGSFNTAYNTYKQAVDSYPIKYFFSENGVRMSRKDRYNTLTGCKAKTMRGKYASLGVIFEPTTTNSLRFKRCFIRKFDKWYKEKYGK